MSARQYRLQHRHEPDIKLSAASPSKTPVLVKPFEVVQTARSRTIESEKVNAYSWTEVPLPTARHTQEFTGRYSWFCKAPC